jgi:predicted dehydrogenase
LALNYTSISVVTGKPLPGEFCAVTAYRDIDEAFKHSRFEAAFICTPTAHHLTSLFKLLAYKTENIFVEKPVSHTTEKMEEILALAAGYKNNIKVGYDLHFDPGIQKIRQLLQQQVIGRVVTVNAFVGQYLPHWRPYEDYRKGMSARKETGGGVLLDIIHEFDYLRWLTGPVSTVACTYTNTGTLEIETEEAAEVLLKFANGATGTIHLDYLQPELVRHCIFTGTKGSITANLARGTVDWMLHDGTKHTFSYAGFERNDRFVAIIQAFLQNNTDDRLTSLTEGLQSLQVVEAAKKSSENNCFVTVNSIN